MGTGTWTPPSWSTPITLGFPSQTTPNIPILVTYHGATGPARPTAKQGICHVSR